MSPQTVAGEMTLVKFDHMMVPVSDCLASRDWYVRNLGFHVEFENLKTGTVAIQDDNDFTIFLQNAREPLTNAKCSLTIQVEDVDAVHRRLADMGLPFVNSPKRMFWGYGAELEDPNRYLIRLWDEKTMREKGSA
jgi:catechol 2,3-dioxygenase-like lactoylglutathione lyase family enzyme